MEKGTKFSEELIHKYLYGYKTDMRLVSSEDVLHTLQKDLSRKCHRLPETPPLSPRKIRVPDEVSLCTSSVPGNLFGACAIKRIPHGTWFGPFEGKLVRTTDVTEGVNNEYMWEIFHDGEVSHFLDGFNENNWMSFVRCARHKKEQNLVVFQYHGCIYYRTTRDIHPGSELLVWYDTKYTQLLGIPLAWNDNRNSNNKRKSQNQTESDSNKRKKELTTSLLQKLEPKPSPRKTCDIETLLDVSKRLEMQSKTLSLDLSPTLPMRCEKCHFSFHSKDQLLNHKCMAVSWTPTSRLPSMDKFRESYFNRPIHVMPYTDPISYYNNYFQRNVSNYHYPSPPMDPLRQLSSVAHKGAPIAIKNF